jgi:tetratricopeptide (TPR) repeat protein
MTANYRVFGSFSYVRRLGGVFFAAAYIILLPLLIPGTAAGQPKNQITWLDSARKFTSLAKYDSALKCLNRSLQSSITAKDSTGIANAYYHTGIVHGLRSKYKESVIVQQKAFVVYQKIRNNEGAIRSLLSLGNSSVRLKKYPDAKQFYKQSLERAQRARAFEQMVEAYNGLANVAEAQKDFKAAITNIRFMQGAYDSIAERDHKQKLHELEEKYSTQLEDKDRELVEMESQHRKVKTDRLLRLIERDDIRLTFYSVALGLTFVVFVLAIAWFAMRRNARMAETKLRREQAGIKTANEQFEIISRQIHDQLTSGIKDSQSQVGNMMDIIWLINPNNRSLESLIAYIKEKTNVILKQSGINYMIVVPDKIPNVQLASLERVNLYMVTRDLIIYSVDVSKATGLTLSITLEGRQLIFKVKDNSKQVDELTARKRESELKPFRDRMEQIDGTIGLVMEQGAMVVIFRKDLP